MKKKYCWLIVCLCAFLLMHSCGQYKIASLQKTYITTVYPASMGNKNRLDTSSRKPGKILFVNNKIINFIILRKRLMDYSLLIFDPEGKKVKTIGDVRIDLLDLFYDKANNIVVHHIPTWGRESSWKIISLSTMEVRGFKVNYDEIYINGKWETGFPISSENGKLFMMIDTAQKTARITGRHRRFFRKFVNFHFSDNEVLFYELFETNNYDNPIPGQGTPNERRITYNSFNLTTRKMSKIFQCNLPPNSREVVNAFNPKTGDCIIVFNRHGLNNSGSDPKTIEFLLINAKTRTKSFTSVVLSEKYLVSGITYGGSNEYFIAMRMMKRGSIIVAVNASGRVTSIIELKKNIPNIHGVIDILYANGRFHVIYSALATPGKHDIYYATFLLKKS